MPEIKDWISNGVALLSIVVTAIFSYLIWKATQKSNEVAKANYKLSELIVETQKNFEKAISQEYKRTILKNAIEIYNALASLAQNYDSKVLKNLPNSCGLTEEQLAKYFYAEERELVNKAWNSFINYIEQFRIEPNGELITIFDNKIETRIQKAEQPIKQFYNLIEILKQALK